MDPDRQGNAVTAPEESPRPQTNPTHTTTKHYLNAYGSFLHYNQPWLVPPPLEHFTLTLYTYTVHFTTPHYLLLLITTFSFLIWNIIYYCVLLMLLFIFTYLKFLLIFIYVILYCCCYVPVEEPSLRTLLLFTCIIRCNKINSESDSRPALYTLEQRS